MPRRKTSQSTPKATVSHPWWNHAWLQAAALIAMAIVVYLPALRGGFIWDDWMYLTQGALMRRPFWKLWVAPEVIDYLPLTYTLYWLQWRIWQDSAAAFHLVNVLLHGGAAIMLWRVLRRLQVRGAWIAAAIFAVHPVGAESVAWIAEEKNTLSLLVAAIALLLYLDSRPRRYWMAVVAFALALFAKPAVIMLPVVMLLLAWWKRGAIMRTEYLRTAPFFALSAIFVPVTIWYQKRSIGTEHIPLGGFGERLAQVTKAAWFYVYKLLLRRDLMFFYPNWKHSGLDVFTVAGLVALIAVAAGLWRMRAPWGRGPLAAGRAGVLLGAAVAGAGTVRHGVDAVRAGCRPLPVSGDDRGDRAAGFSSSASHPFASNAARKNGPPNTSATRQAGATNHRRRHHRCAGRAHLRAGWALSGRRHAVARDPGSQSAGVGRMGGTWADGERAR